MTISLPCSIVAREVFSQYRKYLLLVRRVALKRLAIALILLRLYLQLIAPLDSLVHFIPPIF